MSFNQEHAKKMVEYYDSKIVDLKSQLEVARFNLNDCKKVRRNWKRKLKSGNR